MNKWLAAVLFAFLTVWACGSAFAGALQDLEEARTAELMGRDERALELFDAAIASGELQGVHLAEALNARGDLHALKGRTREALADYGRALELDPQNGAYFLDRAALRKESGDCAGAVEDYSRALELDSSLVTAYMGRSDCLERLGDQAAASEDREQLDQLADSTQRLPEVETRTSWQINEEYSEAIAHYDEAVRIAPTDPGAYVDRGMALMNLGRLDQALNDFNRAIQLDPDWAAAYYNRGFVWHKMGESGRARQDWSRAHQIDPRIEMPQL